MQTSAETEEPGCETLGGLLFKCVIKEDGYSSVTIDLLGDFSVGVCEEATCAPSNFWSLRSMERLPAPRVWWSPLRQGFLGKEKLLFFCWWYWTDNSPWGVTWHDDFYSLLLQELNDEERTRGRVCKRGTSYPCLLPSGDPEVSLRDTII